jgi:hypothetical protein
VLLYYCSLLYMHCSWFTFTVQLNKSNPKTYIPPVIIHAPTRITGHNLFVRWSEGRLIRVFTALFPARPAHSFAFSPSDPPASPMVCLDRSHCPLRTSVSAAMCRLGVGVLSVRLWLVGVTVIYEKCSWGIARDNPSQSRI